MPGDTPALDSLAAVLSEICDDDAGGPGRGSPRPSPLRLGAAADLALPDVPGAVVYCATSGSTGLGPSVVALGAAELRHAVAATHEGLGGPGSWLLSLPGDHIAGLMVRLRARLAGGALVEGDGPFTAAGFASDVARLSEQAPGRRYGSLVPTQLRRVLADERASAAAATLDAVLIGGAAAPPELLARARAAGIRAVTTYGMTETAGGCVYGGVPLRGTDVTVRDGGRIIISGGQVALGYVTPAGLQPFGGVVVTNDRGRWVTSDDAEPRLEVLGRLDDVVVTGGVNVDPGAVERVALGVAGVREAGATGVPDPEWGQALCLALGTEVGWDPVVVGNNVRAAIRAKLSAAHVPKRLHAGPGSLPVAGPGKIDRRAIARMFARED